MKSDNKFFVLGRIEPLQEFDDTIIELINKHSPRKISRDEVNVRSCLLASTELTSHFGFFKEPELNQIKDKIVGRPLIRGHDRSSLPLAQIFHAELKEVDGNNWVHVYFYWMKETSYSKDLETNIDGGVYREVSFQFSAERTICSVCGKDIRQCPHIPGIEYDGQIAAFHWQNILAVTEASIVPAGSTPNTRIINPLNPQLQNAGKINQLAARIKNVFYEADGLSYQCCIPSPWGEICIGKTQASSKQFDKDQTVLLDIESFNLAETGDIKMDNAVPLGITNQDDANWEQFLKYCQLKDTKELTVPIRRLLPAESRNEAIINLKHAILLVFNNQQTAALIPKACDEQFTPIVVAVAELPDIKLALLDASPIVKHPRICDFLEVVPELNPIPAVLNSPEVISLYANFCNLTLQAQQNTRIQRLADEIETGTRERCKSIINILADTGQYAQEKCATVKSKLEAATLEELLDLLQELSADLNVVFPPNPNSQAHEPNEKVLASFSPNRELTVNWADIKAGIP